MKMEQAVREYRVWCVSGDLAGASVYHRRAWWTVELEPFYTADRTKPKGFRSQQDAYNYAQQHAEMYLAQALETERNMHEAEGCCVPSDEDMQGWQDDYWITVVDNEIGRTIESWEN
jgi:hypothetical protein